MLMFLIVFDTLYVDSLSLEHYFSVYYKKFVEQEYEDLKEILPIPVPLMFLYQQKKLAQKECRIQVAIVDSAKKFLKGGKLKVNFRCGFVFLKIDQPITFVIPETSLVLSDIILSTAKGQYIRIIPIEIKREFIKKLMKETQVSTAIYKDTSGKEEISFNLKIISIDTLPFVQMNNFKIFYSRAIEESLVQHFAERMDNLHEKVKEYLGRVFKGPYGAVILPHSISDSNVKIQIKAEKDENFGLYFPIILPISEFDYHLLTHELVEASLVPIIYSLDYTTRWIGDGLAEYVSFKICPSKEARIVRLKDLYERVRKLDKIGMKYYNFVKYFYMPSPQPSTKIEKRWVIPGYALSFYLWYKVCKKVGDRVIKKFLDRVEEKIETTGKLTNDDCIRILEGLTGMDIKSMVYHCDVRDAERTLRELLKEFEK